MTEIAWHLLQPVDVGAQTIAGFQVGMGLTKKIQTAGALRNYMANPDDPNATGALAYFDPETLSALEQRRAAALKAQREAQDRERAVALGELYNADPRAAREAAVGAGDFDLADQFGKMDEAQRKQSADLWTQAGSVAFRMKGLATPEERAAYWQQARPILEQQGAPAEMLDQVDPNNIGQLDAIAAAAQKVGDLWQQTKPQEFNVGPGEGRYERDPITGAVRTIIAPNAGDVPMGTPVSAPPQAQGVVGTVLSGAGLPPHVVSGFLGNFAVEGGYSGAQGDGGSAAGLAQWRGDRQANFARVIGKPVGQATPEEQARFVLWEMQNPQAAGMTVEQRDAILNAKDAGEAADLIDRYYERSSGQHRPHRVASARAIAAAAASSPEEIRAAAQRAIAAGADPEKVRARLAAQGVAM